MNNTSTIAEKTLIENCINGNRKSQKELYDLFYSKNQMDAEDILQDAFVKLFNNLYKFRGEGSFEGWVRRIFVNTAIEHLRRNNLNFSESEGFENSIADKQKSALDGHYEKDLIKTSMKLSEGYRTVFSLYAIEGDSHKAIAQKLGIT